MPLEEVGKPDGGLIPQVRLGWHTKHLVQLLKRKLLSFSDEAEDHDPRHDIKSSVEAECTCGCHDTAHAWEGEREDSGKSVVDADNPGHALLTLDGRKDLGRVLEGDRTFAERVHDGEEVDKENDRPNLCAARACVIQERKSSC